METKPINSIYDVGSTVRVYIDLPYGEDSWEYGVIARKTKEFVTVKLNHPHRKYPNGYVTRANKYVDLID